jgi:hypothetical protein
MPTSQQLSDSQDCKNEHKMHLWVSLGIAALYGLAGSLFFFTRRKVRPPGKKIDIEIRYETEKTADTTMLAQNLVKIIRMVLTPLESKISKESAQLIFVYSDEAWEMRVRNGSENLRHSVKRLLEAKEW